MHVLIIPSEHFVTERYPQGGIFQLHQARALQRAGFEVGVLGTGIISPRFLFQRYRYPRLESPHGYPVLRGYSRMVTPHRWQSFDSAVKRYEGMGSRLFREYERRFGTPDLLHAHNLEYAGFIARRIGRERGIPYLVTEHSGLFKTGTFDGARAAALAGCAGEACRVAAVSRALARAMERVMGVADVEVIPNLVEAEMLAVPLGPAPFSGSEAVFLTIGSMDENKNQAMLIRAFATSFRGRAATLRIGGKGPLRSHLADVAREAGVAEQVVFLDHLTRADVARELAAADCFVLPSLSETFGVVLIEALATGTPVIASRCGGPEDIVHEGNGVLVEPGELAALADALTAMAESGGRFQREALRADCAARFGDRPFVERVRDLYAACSGAAAP